MPPPDPRKRESPAQSAGEDGKKVTNQQISPQPHGPASQSPPPSCQHSECVKEPLSFPLLRQVCNWFRQTKIFKRSLIFRARTFMFKTPRENCSTLTSVFDLTLHGFVEGADTTALRLLSRHCKQSGNGLTATVLRLLPVSFTACLLS